MLFKFRDQIVHALLPYMLCYMSSAVHTLEFTIPTVLQLYAARSTSRCFVSFRGLGLSAHSSSEVILKLQVTDRKSTDRHVAGPTNTAHLRTSIHRAVVGPEGWYSSDPVP